MTRGMAPAPRPVVAPLPRLVRVLVVGPPLRVGPLLAARSPATMLSFTDDPAEGTSTDVLVLTRPAMRDVPHVRRLAEEALLLVVVPRGTRRPRTDRLLAAGADVCLLDPDADELAPYFRGTVTPRTG